MPNQLDAVFVQTDGQIRFNERRQQHSGPQVHRAAAVVGAAPQPQTALGGWGEPLRVRALGGVRPGEGEGGQVPRGLQEEPGQIRQGQECLPETAVEVVPGP
jgi:hypothetical protein